MRFGSFSALPASPRTFFYPKVIDPTLLLANLTRHIALTLAEQAAVVAALRPRTLRGQ